MQIIMVGAGAYILVYVWESAPPPPMGCITQVDVMLCTLSLLYLLMLYLVGVSKRPVLLLGEKRVILGELRHWKGKAEKMKGR